MAVLDRAPLPLAKSAATQRPPRTFRLKLPDMLRDDLTGALRHALRWPVFAIGVTATLAASIGAATAAFGLARAVLWRPLPFADASRLVFVWEEVRRDGEQYPSRVTGFRYAAWRDGHAERSPVISMALFGAVGFTLESSSGALSV